MSNRTLRISGRAVYDCHYHIVWVTKYRRPVLHAAAQTRLKELVQAVAAEKDVLIDEIETMEDHVHMLVSVPPQLTIGQFVKACKGRTSRELRSEFEDVSRGLRGQLWTHSYFVATTGGAPLEVIKEYVQSQKTRSNL